MYGTKSVRENKFVIILTVLIMFFTVIAIAFVSVGKETEHADAVALVEIRHNAEHLRAILRALDQRAELLHLLADALVVDLLLLLDGLEMLDDIKAIEPRRFFQRAEVIREQLAEDFEIVLDKAAHAALARAMLLADERERRLRHREQECDVVVPEIAIEAVDRRDVEHAVDLRQDAARQFPRIIIRRIKISTDIRKSEQDAVLADLAIDDEFGNKTMHEKDLSSLM